MRLASAEMKVETHFIKSHTIDRKDFCPGLRQNCHANDVWSSDSGSTAPHATEGMKVVLSLHSAVVLIASHK